MAARSQSPFPGMDPWLEHPARWPNVHQRLITYASDRLQQAVGERYLVSIGERVYVEVADQSYYPDLWIAEGARSSSAPYSESGADRPVVVVVPEAQRREVFLEIVDAAGEGRVVTVLEVLSPGNKRAGPGRDLYLRQQRDVLASTANLVEIDLLRGGEPTIALPRHHRHDSAYRVLVSPAADRSRRELYPIALRSRLPRVAVPLLAADRPAVLDLGALLAETYEKGSFGRRIDYGEPPVPPLAPEDEAWAREVVTARAG